MATLQRIRNRAGILIAIIIGLALFAFVLGDFLTSGQSFYQSSRMNIAEINGKSISIETFNQMYDEMQQLYMQNTNQTSIDERTREGIREQTWRQLVETTILEREYKKLGLAVCKDEFWDMLTGINPNPTIVQIFTNPQTGMFDRSHVTRFLKSMQEDESGQSRASWMMIEKEILKERIQSKYNNMVMNGLYVTKLQGERDFQEANKVASFSYVVQRYNTISDSSVSVSESELKNYYKEHKYQYKQDPTRNIEYVIYDIVPSKEDYAEIEQKITEIKPELASSVDPAYYVNNNSDSKYDDRNYKYGDLSALYNDSLFSAQEGATYGPYLENESYKLVKLVKIQSLPDSVQVRHILIQAGQNRSMTSAKSIADSLLLVIKRGGKFDELAVQYSEDQGSSTNGGDLGWFTEGRMVKSFSDSCFYGKKGQIKVVESPYGYHIINIVDQSAYIKKVKVAILELKVIPSRATNNQIYAQVSKLGGTNRTRDKLVSAAQSEGKLVQTAEGVRKNDANLAGVESPRQIIQWAFNAKKGEVSNIFEFPDKYVVATVADIHEDEYATFEQKKKELEMLVRRDKKAEQIIAKIKSAGAGSIDQLAGKLATRVESASNVSFAIPSFQNIGYEPKLQAAIVNSQANVMSDPIKGENGVYVIVVNSVTQNPVNDPSYSMQIAKITRNYMSRVNYGLMDALEKTANVEDNRSNFF